jgi:hypothetical protein
VKRQQAEFASLDKDLAEDCQRIEDELFDLETCLALLKSGDSNPGASSLVGAITMARTKKCSKLRKKLGKKCVEH